MANEEVINTGFVSEIQAAEGSPITVAADAGDPGKYTVGIVNETISLNANSDTTGLTPKVIKSKFILREKTANDIIPAKNEPIVIWNDGKAQIVIGDGVHSIANLSLIGHVPLADGAIAGTVKEGGDITIADGIITVVDDSHTHNTQYYPISDIDTKLSGIDTKLGNKVDKIDGKGLSEEDFTNDLLKKLNDLPANAQKNVQSDWSITDSNSDAFILNKPNLADVATSGNYEDLDDKPALTTYKFVDGESIYTPSTKKLLISLNEYENGKDTDRNIQTTIDLSGLEIHATAVKGDVLNSSSNATPILIFQNEKVAYNSNDIVIKYDSSVQKTGIAAEFFDGKVLLNNVVNNYNDSTSPFAKVATSGDYDDLINIPPLKTVAISGSYNDLTDRPQFSYDSDDKALIIYPK